MKEARPPNKLSDFQEVIVSQLAQLGLAIDDIGRPASEEDVQYLLDQCHYLQVVTTDEVQGWFEEPEVAKLKTSEWMMIDYGDAVCVSSGLWFESKANRKRAQDAIRELMERLLKKGWKNMRVVDGTQYAKFMLAIAATKQELSYDGIELSKDELKKAERSVRSRGEEIKNLRDLKETNYSHEDHSSLPDDELIPD